MKLVIQSQHIKTLEYQREKHIQYKDLSLKRKDKYACNLLKLKIQTNRPQTNQQSVRILEQNKENQDTKRVHKQHGLTDI